MKKFILLLAIVFVIKAYGQVNLVPNPSFEIYSTCPDNISGTQDDQVSKATGWSSWIKTPDYYNVCPNLLAKPKSYFTMHKAN
jgi:hypothetical protein